MKKRKLRKSVYKLYSVDWYRGTWNYRTTTNCKWEDVLECKRAAKLMGETIKYEAYDTVEYYY